LLPLTVAVSSFARSPVDPQDVKVRLSGAQENAAINGVWRDLRIQDQLSHTGISDLQVEEITASDNRWAGNAVLRAGQPFGWEWRYLFFRELNGRWEFAGHIDFDVQKYAPPDHRITWLGSQGPWLAIRHLVLTGTDLSAYFESWYHWQGGPVKEVLVYPVEGHVFVWVPCFNREVKTKVATGTNRQGTATVTVQFTVDYTANDQDLDLFTAVQSASFIWDPAERCFCLDPQNSQIGEEAIEGIFGDGPDGLLEHQYFNLLRLASRRSPAHRRWLGQFLGLCEDTPKKAALSEFLKKTEPGLEAER